MAQAEHELEAEGQGLKRTLKDLFAGAAGGVAQVLLGQPFGMHSHPYAHQFGLLTPAKDIVKVRLQTTTTYTSALDAATKIYRNEGATAFYKGTLTPLLGIGACYYLSGAFAGIANSVISGPIEHVRIRLQTQPHGARRLYNGPIDCIRKLSAHEGVLKGLYRGELVTILREAQAYGVWFFTFEYLMNADAARNGIRRDEVSTPKVAFYGGLAGEALWIASYPFDVVKSKMQSDGFGKEMRYRGMSDCFRQTWAREGLRGFWKGLAPTLLRAMPVSAGTFAVVEMTMRLLN
ncbi:carrier protein ymc1 [Coniosporium tulheliwenetii]|uniref:Carrier protein ymc1 n=1 Tax=Coniosporium tulheliwenetii TaxID=3383036 RepID=A0ACC2ZIB4_9PEZI|nr:carrier protein ymc1 [Cladosporium sp. JES 115]